MPKILPLSRLRQENNKFQVSLYSFKFKTSLEGEREPYWEISSLKTKPKTQTNQPTSQQKHDKIEDVYWGRTIQKRDGKKRTKRQKDQSRKEQKKKLILSIIKETS